MGLAKIYTVALLGLDVQVVEVEVDIKGGLPKFNIVGLPDKAINEAKDRVSAAMRNSILKFPFKRLTVNLAPADLPKTGPTYDLPIAVGIAKASGQIDLNTDDTIILGELALDGRLREMDGMIAIADGVMKSGFKKLVVPYSSYQEAMLIKGLEILPVKKFSNLIENVWNNKLKFIKSTGEISSQQELEYPFDLKAVKGQAHAKRALEIAAAGGHNILMSGTPGAGKTMLAKTLPSFLPDMSPEETLEVTRIHSISGFTSEKAPLVNIRPFRSPHHTSSDVALVGGGAFPKPGEISLAHRGVLFLDEFPEFSRATLEALRQPLEDKVVTISRASGSLKFPANFMLFAAMNPCKCGWHGDDDKECTCTQIEYNNYQKRISGPILDRIDLQLHVKRVKYSKLFSKQEEESSSSVKKRVQNARNLQRERYKELSYQSNSEIGQQYLKKYLNISTDSSTLLKNAVQRFSFSARSYFRILRVSRTIADLDQSEIVHKNHIAEALSFRMNDG